MSVLTTVSVFGHMLGNYIVSDLRHRKGILNYVCLSGGGSVIEWESMSKEKRGKNTKR